MTKPKVLLLGQIDHAHTSWNSLSTIADLITPQSTSRPEFLKECQTGSLEGVVAVYRTFVSASITGLWDAELINALPKSIEFCIHCGAGYDQITGIAAASERKPKPLRIANVPSAADDATADTAIWLLLGAMRGFNPSLGALRDGKWRGNPAPPLGHDPEGKTLGILGMGGIGRNMKRKLDAFGMEVIYHNRKALGEEMAGGAEYVSFEELLARSDVLSLNLPLNKNTRHIISTSEFSKMRKGVVIINTARGAVMDEDALVKALESGQVRSCGLDVFEEEPKIHPGLIANPNVLLLPHMGTWCVETQAKMEETCIANIRAALEKGKLNNIIQEQAELA